jgi:hypothetical protein
MQVKEEEGGRGGHYCGERKGEEEGKTHTHRNIVGKAKRAKELNK